MRFPKIFQFRRMAHTSSIARQRLMLMNESEPIECAPDVMAHMKQEISDVIGKYLAVPAEDYEIKVILKHKRNPEPAPSGSTDTCGFEGSVALTAH